MRDIKALKSICLVLSFCLMAGCGQVQSSGGGGSTDIYFDTTLADGTIALSVAHMAVGSFKYIVPLGNLNPSDHTLPTDHIYYVHEDTTETIPVYAPADGKILDIHTFTYASGHDNRLIVGTHKYYSYYLIHLVADSGLKKGDTVTAGQQLGVASNKAAAVDIGVLNKNSLQAFINAGHYATMNKYSDAPLKYYAEPLKSQLYSYVQRLGSDKDGTFCYDQAGKLVGGWFLEGVSNDEAISGTAVGTKEIAFVYSNYDPTQINISVGGTVITKGVYYVQSGATDPAAVDTSTGKVTYKLYSDSGKTTRVGLLIAQMQSADTVKIEAFSDTVSDTADFTPAAYTYTR